MGAEDSGLRERPSPFRWEGWGELAAGSLLVVMASGLLLALDYQPGTTCSRAATER